MVMRVRRSEQPELTARVRWLATTCKERSRPSSHDVEGVGCTLFEAEVAFLRVGSGEDSGMLRRPTAVILLTTVAALLVVPSSTSPSVAVTFAGQNGAIAFVTGEPSGTDRLWAIAPDGSNQVEIFTEWPQIAEPAWSPDGQHLAFLAYGCGNPLAGRSQVCTIRGDGSGVARLSGTGGGGRFSPRWSPDGPALVYSTADFVSCSPDPCYSLTTHRLDETLPASPALSSGDVSPHEAAWSPDGNRLAFVTTRDGDDEIYVVGVDGSDPTNLTGNSARDTAPSWSPDGSRVAFVSDRNGNDEILVMNADGSEQHPLAAGTLPMWSPDGEWIAFAANGAIHIIRPDGTDHTFLADGTEHTWSPDSTKLAYADGGIHVIDVDGSNRTPIASEGRQPTWQRLSSGPPEPPQQTVFLECDEVAGDLRLRPALQATAGSLVSSAKTPKNGPGSHSPCTADAGTPWEAAATAGAASVRARLRTVTDSSLTMPDGGLACVPENSTYPASGKLTIRLDQQDSSGKYYEARAYVRLGRTAHSSHPDVATITGIVMKGVGVGSDLEATFLQQPTVARAHQVGDPTGDPAAALSSYSGIAPGSTTTAGRVAPGLPSAALLDSCAMGADEIDRMVVGTDGMSISAFDADPDLREATTAVHLHCVSYAEPECIQAVADFGFAYGAAYRSGAYDLDSSIRLSVPA
jgi:Tol biopolymer transport system component